jgi:hypothetical protein
MGEIRTVLDREHPCLACGEPWLVQLQMRAHPHAFIVWKPRGLGRCSARCHRTSPATYYRGVQERMNRGWMRPRTLAAITSGSQSLSAPVGGQTHGW